METLINKANLVRGGIIAILTAICGQYWFLFAGLIVFNVIDWLTGWYYAYINHLESSKVGAKGIVKKVGYWIVIFVAFYIGNCFVGLGELLGVNLGFSIGIGWFVLASYLVNEIRSILENAVKLGWNVPEFLIKGLEIADNAIDKATNKNSDNN